jgi:hypothetical protein
VIYKNIKKDGKEKMEKEIWKNIKGYEGLYQVSNLGRVRSLKRSSKNILTGSTGTTGYRHVILTKNGILKNRDVHRIVAEHFIPNPDNLPQINHKDENILNNEVSNLEWCTAKYNCNYGNHKLKLSLAHKNRITTGRPAVKVYCPELKKVFDSTVDAAKALGCTQSAVSHCLRGDTKTIKKMHLEYYNG